MTVQDEFDLLCSQCEQELGHHSPNSPFLEIHKIGPVTLFKLYEDYSSNPNPKIIEKGDFLKTTHCINGHCVARDSYLNPDRVYLTKGSSSSTIWSLVNPDASSTVKVCKFFTRGGCKYQDDCKSFHGTGNVLKKCRLGTRATEDASSNSVFSNSSSSRPSKDAFTPSRAHNAPRSNGQGRGNRGGNYSHLTRRGHPSHATKPENSPRSHAHSSGSKINSIQNFLRLNKTSNNSLNLLRELNASRHSVLEKLQSDPPTDKQMVDFATFLSDVAWEWDPNFNELVNTLVEWSSFISRINQLPARPVCTLGIDYFVAVLEFMVVLSKKRVDGAKHFVNESLNNLVQNAMDNQLHSDDVKARIYRAWLQLQGLLTDSNIRIRQDQRRKELNNDEETVDIQNIPILPEARELFGQVKITAPHNATRWSSLNAYRSAHYLMLREEYIGPLREVVQDLFSMHAANGRQHYVLYSEVIIRTPKFQGNAFTFDVSFRVANRKFIDFSRMNKLQFGSLVVLFPLELNPAYNKGRFSRDMVQDALQKAVFATIGHCEIKNGGLPNISLSFLAEEFYRVIPGAKYCMVESPAYFVAYEPVLNALRRADVMESNPLAGLLVLSQQLPNSLPKYILDKGQLNISAIYTDRAMYLPSINTILPPGSILDQSQSDAVQHALTHQVALIHGPPGTGKSFVGVQLARIVSSISTPILIVTYTNHALDQFLEQISLYIPLNELIRCGSNRRKEEEDGPLESCRIGKVARNTTDDYHDKKRIREEIDGAIKSFTNVLKVLNNLGDDYRKQKTMEDLFWEIIPPNPYKRKFLMLPGIFRAVFEIRDSPRDIVMEAYRAWLGGTELILVEEWKRQYIQLIERSHQNNRHAHISHSSNTFGCLGEEGLDDEANGVPDEEGLPSLDDFHDEYVDDVIEEKSDDESDDEPTAQDSFSKGKEPVRDEQSSLSQLQVPIPISSQSNVPTLISEDYNIFDDLNEEQLDRVFSYVPDEFDKDDDFKTVKRRDKRQGEQSSADVPPDVRDKLQSFVESLLGSLDIWQIAHHERIDIILRFGEKVIELMKQKSYDFLTLIEDKEKNLTAIRNRGYIRAAKAATVVGMTSTFASKNFSFVSAIQPKVAIIEEAGELLESQLLTSVNSRNLEHLILIGDHLQLKPKLESMALKRQNWDVSLFERLVKSDFSKSMLNTQQRMHPQIASLTKHFYDAPILDHPSVNAFPAIPSIGDRVFWLTHIIPEDKILDDAVVQSKSHSIEAKFVVLLARFILHQGIKPTKVTILSAYVQQVRNVRRLIREVHKELSDIKVSTVDNYQGDENDIVILSLVRSNADDRAGFLKEENRAIVALSRARHALFIVGNPEMLKQEDAWNPVLSLLGRRNQINAELVVACQQHPDRQTLLNIQSDFANVRWGGCSLPCKFLLKCGHLCRMSCHTIEHQPTQCIEPCARKRSCEHTCASLCGTCDSATDETPDYETCKTKCFILVERNLICGHIQKDPCSLVGLPKCRTPISEKRDCGHMRVVMCHLRDKPWVCRAPVSVKLPCGHLVNKVCSDPADPKCPMPCEVKYEECHHSCPQKCGDNHQHARRDCPQDCDSILICQHECQAGCGKPHTIQCQRPCSTHCLHGARCGRKCFEECTPCKEPCTNACQHRKCSKRCFEECDVEPCNERCSRIMNCAHRCFGLCGEICPECPFCDPNLAQLEDLFTLETIGSLCEAFKKTEDFNMTIFQQQRLHLPGNMKMVPYLVKTENTLYKLNCNHTFTTAFLDGHFTTEAASGHVKLVSCPTCRRPIFTAVRYGHLMKKMLKMYEQVKLKQKQQLQEAELQMVINAMRDSERTHGYSNIGHWFYCPNGHPYFIGDCGGAVLESRCPDCGAIVGGTHHSPAAGNTFAAIDGAIAPSWPGMATPR